MARHRLVLVDRGVARLYRWQPTCSCGGYIGVPRRTGDGAAEEFREGHLHPLDKHTRTTRRRMPKPRPLTPAAELPDALR